MSIPLFRKLTNVPVVDALRLRIKRQGLFLVADEFCVHPNYLEQLAYQRRPMSEHVARLLGYEKVITWRHIRAGVAPITSKSDACRQVNTDADCFE